MTAFLSAGFAALLGLAVGGLLNVLIDRIPAGERVTAGPCCSSCQKTLGAADLIPLLSFVMLRGRCRHCGAKISPRYPLVELLSAVLFLADYWAFSLSPRFLLYAAFSSVLIVIAFIDIDHRVIYLGMNLFILLLGAAACLISPLAAWYARPLGLLAASLPLLIILVASRGGMGLGDVELAAAGGFLLGWPLALLSLLIACIASSVIGLAAAGVKRTGLKTAIPFGPFLALGFTVSSLFGGTIIAAYLAFFR